MSLIEAACSAIRPHTENRASSSQLLVLLCVLTATLMLTGAAGATTYYVSPAGNDGNVGVSPEAPWRTLAKADSAPLVPGDTVLLEGGAIFANTLSPSRSGQAGAPITYGTYGSGRATIAGVNLNSVSHLTFDGLAVTGTSQAVLASGSGSGSRGITLRNLVISDVTIAINSANTADADWIIEGNSIDRTQDSAVIVYGANFQLTRNTIRDAGLSTVIAYGKHGIYAKGPGARIVGNVITNFQANGISIRHPNAVVEGNTVSGGPIAVAYFQGSTRQGRSVIRRNALDATTAAVYLDPSTTESFLLHDNTITSLGKGIHAKTVTALWVWSNAITAPIPILSDTVYQTSPPADYADSLSPVPQPEPTPQPTPEPTPQPTPDTTVPTVAITNPADRARVSRRITITAVASDDTAIASVAFYVDGRLACTDGTAAYTCAVRLARGRHTLTARAIDTSGNVDLSAVTVWAA